MGFVRFLSLDTMCWCQAGAEVPHLSSLKSATSAAAVALNVQTRTTHRIQLLRSFAWSQQWQYFSHHSIGVVLPHPHCCGCCWCQGTIGQSPTLGLPLHSKWVRDYVWIRAHTVLMSLLMGRAIGQFLTWLTLATLVQNSGPEDLPGFFPDVMEAPNKNGIFHYAFSLDVWICSSSLSLSLTEMSFAVLPHFLNSSFIIFILYCLFFL